MYCCKLTNNIHVSGGPIRSPGAMIGAQYLVLEQLGEVQLPIALGVDDNELGDGGRLLATAHRHAPVQILVPGQQIVDHQSRRHFGQALRLDLVIGLVLRQFRVTLVPLDGGWRRTHRLTRQFDWGAVFLGDRVLRRREYLHPFGVLAVVPVADGARRQFVGDVAQSSGDGGVDGDCRQ